METLKNITKNGSIDLFSKNPLRTVTKARLVRSIIQDDYVDVTVESVEPISFSLEDRIEVENRDYFLNLNPKVTKNSSRNFVYDLRYEGVSYLLRKIKLFNRDNQGRETDFNFSLTTDLEGFLSIILNNANHKSNDWVLGTVPSNTETKRLSFNNQKCLSALQDICSEYSVEFDFVKSGGKYQLNIGDLGSELDFTFEYGKGKGLYSLTRQSVADTEVVTRLYGFGSSQNLPTGYRDYSQKLRMPESFGDYVESQELIDLFGFVEDIHESDIKPEFKGKVTTVGTLADGLLKFTSNDMDFDLKETESNGDTKYLIPEQPAVISFLTGRLAGYEFDVHDYNHSTKEFQIIQYTDDRGLTLPDGNAFKLIANDEFTILNIKMPQSYVTDAENRLKTEVEDKYNQISRNNIKYVLNADPLFLRSKSIHLGDVAPIKDSDLDVDKEIRIVKIEYDLLSDKYSLDLSDTYEVSLVKEIVNEIHKVNKNINRNRAETRRTYMQGYKRLKELQNSIFDPDGYFDTENIKPGSIETGMISVGALSQRLNLEDVVFTPNYQGNSNAVNITAGTLVHFTIEPNIRTWNMSAKTQTGLNSNSTYYIYARCSRSGNNGTWLITTDKIQFDQDGNYWHFLVALLYKPQDNVRLIDLLYGATFIQGGQIRTGRIQSIDGNVWFDLDTGEIHGKISFTSDSPAKTLLEQYADLQAQAAENNSKSYADGIKGDAYQHAQELIDSLSFGDKNLLIGTEKLAGWAGSHSSFEFDEEEGAYKVTKDKNETNQTTRINYSGAVFNRLNLLPNQEYTLQVDIKQGGDYWSGLGYAPGANGIQFKPDLSVRITGKAKDTSGIKDLGNGYVRVWMVMDGSDFTDFRIFVNYQSSTELGDYIFVKNVKLTEGNKPRTWTPAIEDIEAQVQDAQQAAQDYADAQDNLKEIETKAWADGKIDAEEARAIDDAIARRDEAKAYAVQQDNELNDVLEAYADSKANQAENEAKDYADEAVDKIKIGGKNYFSDSDFKNELSFSTQDTNPNIAEYIDSIDDSDVRAVHIKVSNQRAYINPNAIIPCKKGDKITFSIQSTSNDLEFWLTERDSSGSETERDSRLNFPSYKNGIATYTRTISNNNTTSVRIERLGIGVSYLASGEAKFQKPKLERGGNRTIWNYILEQADNSINENYNSLSADINQAKADSLEDAKELVYKGRNFIIISDLNLGQRVDPSNGSLVSSNNTDATDYVETDGNEKWNYSTTGIGGSNLSIAFYNGSKSFISGFQAPENQRADYSFTAPSSAKYIRLSHDLIQEAKLERGSTATKYSVAPEDISDRSKWLETTVDGNVIATGALMVGNPVGGSNAGISGAGTALDSIRIWSGGSYKNRSTARWYVRDDGVMVFTHTNGNVAFEFGLNDEGTFVMNGYNPDGFKIFELSSTRGLIAKSYIPESWTKTNMIKLNQTGSSLNTNSAVSTIRSRLSHNVNRLPDTESGELWGHDWTVSYNLTAYEYNNGTHPDNSQYEANNGMKKTNSSRTNNIDNGWYMGKLTILSRFTSSSVEPQFQMSVTAIYYQSGKENKTQVFQLTNK